MKEKTLAMASLFSATIMTGALLLNACATHAKPQCGGSCALCGLCGQNDRGKTYYIEKKEALVKSFTARQKAFKPFLAKYYGNDEVKIIVEETGDAFEALIPEIPYIGGDDNPRTEDIEQSAMALAFYEVQKRHGRTTVEIGTIITSAVRREISRYPRFLLRLTGARFFTSAYIKQEELAAARSLERRYEYDWVTEFVRGEGFSFDYGCDHTQCGVFKYLSDHGAGDLTPYLCSLDFIYSDAFGEGLERKGTIAEGYPVCDFRFTRE